MWTCSPDLRLSLLLKDDDSGKLLDRDTVYNFYPVEDHQPASQLNLICTTGRHPPKLSVYMMPEAQPDTEYAELTVMQEPVAGILLSGEEELGDFRDAKILAIFSVNVNSDNDYVVIAQGKSSIITLDREKK